MGAQWASGLDLVVPGYFICVGILLFAAVTAAAVGLYRGRLPIYLAFAAACLASAGVAAATASYYLSESVAGAVSAQRWLATSTLMVTASLVAFIALYTDLRGKRRWLAIMGAWIAVLVAANHVLPYGVRFSSVTSFGWVHLPWGESIFRIRGESSPWSLAYRLLTVVVAGWCIWRLGAHFRTGFRRSAALLGVCIFVLMLASVQGALIDRGYIEGFHYNAFALVGLALLAGAGLMVRMQEQNDALELTASQLRAENELRREAEAQIRSRAYRDALTGLPNRIYVQDHLGAFIAAPEGGIAWGAVMALNLDHFKVINDGLSHSVGDELLCEVTRRLQSVVPPGAMLARMGGDEFLAVLDGLSQDEEAVRARIDILAADVARVLAQPHQLGERSLNLFASIGVATFEVPGTTAPEVVRRAGMAMQRAKKKGRNNIQRFVPDLQRDALERFRVVEGLRRAIDAGELSLHYQPQVAADGRVVGAEALMRWRSAEGFIPPSRFIPIAEETGLIHSLGEWSLREGCLKLAAWAREGRAFEGYLSVNVSPWQLARPDFVARTRAIVEASGIAPRRLMLEITESAVLFDVEDTVAKLRELRPLGLRIALDDFGTGYSSLALLKDLPLDAIKIDQSFVRHLDVRANQHLVRMVGAIGEELGLDVIAEGIETEAERAQVEALGCRQMQGYLFSRPLPEEEFLAWRRAPVTA